MFFCFVEGGSDDFVHIGIGVFGESASEYEVVFLRSKSAIFEVEGVVVGVVDRVVSLFVSIPSDRVFACYNGLRLSAVLEVFVFDYASERDFFFGVIDDGIALIVFGVE